MLKTGLKTGVLLTPPLDQSVFRSWSPRFFSVRLPKDIELMPSIVALPRAPETLNSIDTMWSSTDEASSCIDVVHL